MHTQLTSFLVKLSEHTVIKDNKYRYLHWPGTDQYIQVLKQPIIDKTSNFWQPAFLPRILKGAEGRSQNEGQCNAFNAA
eukprot:211188-Amphidinium_carterae.1